MKDSYSRNDGHTRSFCICEACGKVDLMQCFTLMSKKDVPEKTFYKCHGCGNETGYINYHDESRHEAKYQIKPLFWQKRENDYLAGALGITFQIEPRDGPYVALVKHWVGGNKWILGTFEKLEDAVEICNKEWIKELTHELIEIK